MNKLRICPVYAQECIKRKKKNHWANRCQNKGVNETKQYVLEVISENDITKGDMMI